MFFCIIYIECNPIDGFLCDL